MSKLYTTLNGGPIHTETAAQVEALIIQHNSLVKYLRTKEARELARSNFEYYKLISQAVYSDMYELADQIEDLARSVNGFIGSQRGILSLCGVFQEVNP
jgi:hypothetical protein